MHNVFFNYITRMADTDWNDSRVIRVSSDMLSIELKDLRPYGFYSIRVVAKNGLGNSEPSATSSIFHTEREGNYETDNQQL